MKTRSEVFLEAGGRPAETKTRFEAALGDGGGPVETTTAALEAGRPAETKTRSETALETGGRPASMHARCAAAQVGLGWFGLVRIPLFCLSATPHTSVSLWSSLWGLSAVRRSWLAMRVTLWPHMNLFFSTGRKNTCRP